MRHNAREGKKVITKEKYLGKDIPKNIEMIKKEFGKEFLLELNKKLELIRKNFQNEWKKYPESIAKDKIF